MCSGSARELTSLEVTTPQALKRRFSVHSDYPNGSGVWLSGKSIGVVPISLV